MSQDIKKMMHDMQDRIREVAYLMWESAGRQHGMATEYWHAAEREVRAALEAATAKIKPSAASKPEAAKPAPASAPKVAPKPAAPAVQAPAKPASASASKPAPKPAAPVAQAPAKPASAPASKPASKPAAPAATAPAKPAPASAPKVAPKSTAPAATAPAKPAPASAPKVAPKSTAPAATAPAKPASKPAAPTATAPAKVASPSKGYKTEEIEGIGPAYAKKLAAVGIETSDHLLDQCGSAKGRVAVSEKTGITAKLLLKWANMADLMRISGVAGENAELLEAAGVDTVKELKTRKAENLAAKMVEINEKKKLTRRVANVKQVEKWVEQAKALEPRITH